MSRPQWQEGAALKRPGGTGEGIATRPACLQLAYHVSALNGRNLLEVMDFVLANHVEAAPFGLIAPMATSARTRPGGGQPRRPPRRGAAPRGSREDLHCFL